MRIAIVNDETVAVEALRRAIMTVPAYSVAWVARDGAEAVRKCRAERPDVILMDLLMPVMDGVEATRRIMVASPCAILVVTGDVQRNMSKVFAALGAGALDVVNTPTLTDSTRDASAAALLAKIRLIGLLGVSYAPVPALSMSVGEDAATTLIAIGASAGGPPAVAHVLRDLSATLNAAVLVVQHVDAEFVDSMAEWFDSQCSLAVRVAREGIKPAVGCAYLAAGDVHLVVKADGRLAYRAEPLDAPYRPSADVLFSSIAENWRGVAIGVVLSGMGRDGALGLQRLRATGARTIAQDEATSAVYGMPRAAAELFAATDILPISQIGPLIADLIDRPSRVSAMRVHS
ncbi:MAG TPA: chemotaxis-specific protein-glutamate methyltransferase CheB [Gemmatimonadaceae bacterium]|nr:chemotaxis-specific protein-glutamate methyltransferase CheB [Gemmatimonadaceae bacterium]